jgi:hypothetical protein
MEGQGKVWVVSGGEAKTRGGRIDVKCPYVSYCGTSPYSSNIGGWETNHPRTRPLGGFQRCTSVVIF